MSRRVADPFAGFRFKLERNNVEVAGFSECSGLQMEVKTFDYKEGGNNKTTLKFPEHASYGNITLKRGVTNSTELITWQLEVAAGSFARAANLVIVLDDEKGVPARRWNLKRAFPVKWTGPDLKASASEIAIESLEIAHEGIRVDK
ncbi:MAG: phage tail protein [Blastocatellia bacterium]